MVVELASTQQILTNTVSDTGTYTSMVWFSIDAAPSASIAVMVRASGGDYDVLYVDSGLKLIILMNDTGGGTTDSQIVGTITSNTWYCAYMNRPNSSQVDGGTIDLGSMTAGGGFGFSGGNYAMGDTLASGSKIRLYSGKLWEGVSLSASEMLLESRRNRPARWTNLFAWWPMLAGTSRYYDLAHKTTTRDLSLNSGSASDASISAPPIRYNFSSTGYFTEIPAAVAGGGGGSTTRGPNVIQRINSAPNRVIVPGMTQATNGVRIKVL